MPDTQIAVPCASPGHGVQLVVPHEFTDVFDTQLPPQLWYPVRQLARKQVPVVVLQAPVPFVYAVVQLFVGEPQAVSVLAWQLPPDR